ncbi:MAG: heavy metal translocating P-type ATPase [Pseudomonadota bacterium]
MQNQAVTLSLDNLSCASCVGRVDKALAQVQGVSGVSVNLASESVTLSLSGADDLANVEQTLQTLGYPLRTDTVTLSIENMSCASCVGRVEQSLATVPGVRSVVVNLAAETATVELIEGAAELAAVAQAATTAGYPAQLQQAATAGSGVERKAHEAKLLFRRVAIAAALTIPVFILEMGAHLIPAFHMAIKNSIGTQTSWLIQCVLTTAVLLGPGRQFYTRGLPALFKGAPDMNSLVAVGTGAAWGYSMVATFLPWLLPLGVRAVYFEAAAVIVVLILVGRWLEARAKGQTGAAIQSLLGLQARTARVARGDTFVEADVDTLVVGDIIQVRPGERIPIDGEITHGSGNVDESMVTGEPLPVAKTIGSAITGGTINGNGSLTMRTTRVGADTTLAQIVRMVEQAQSAKLPIQELVNRVTLWFVPAVMLVALLTVVVWLLFGPSPALTLALVAGVSVLIIACPCAMGLATPTSIMVGTGRAAQMGVLFRKGDALQELSQVDVIALDKTGTLTEGKPTLTDLVTAGDFSRPQVLALVAAVEARSEHPIADAIVHAAAEQRIAVPESASFQSITGYGVSAEVNGQRVLVGADRLMIRESIDISTLRSTEQALSGQGRSALYAAVDNKLAAVIAVADPVKASSRAAIEALHQRGYQVAMITGDKLQTAKAIAQETGIDHVIAGVLPDGKVAAINDLRNNAADGSHRRVAFVGDGINDAPALAHADVGIAIGTGTDVAIESAEVVLMSGDLRGVVNAVEVSAKTMANIRQNLGWAFGYNMALIPVAAGALYPFFGILLSPVFAAGAMALSSVSVLLNALRLSRIKPAMQENATAQSSPVMLHSIESEA